MAVLHISLPYIVAPGGHFVRGPYLINAAISHPSWIWNQTDFFGLLIANIEIWGDGKFVLVLCQRPAQDVQTAVWSHPGWIWNQTDFFGVLTANIEIWGDGKFMLMLCRRPAQDIRTDVWNHPGWIWIQTDFFCLLVANIEIRGGGFSLVQEMLRSTAIFRAWTFLERDFGCFLWDISIRTDFFGLLVANIEIRGGEFSLIREMLRSTEFLRAWTSSERDFCCFQWDISIRTDIFGLLVANIEIRGGGFFLIREMLRSTEFLRAWTFSERDFCCFQWDISFFV